MKMTMSSLLAKGIEMLTKAGIADADWDAWCLLEYVTGIRRTFFLCDREQLCTREQAEWYQELIEKRMNFVPLQYLTGEQEFMGLSFLVNPHVLIPRQDTEILVEEVVRQLKRNSDQAVLDMCTGSGCILLSLVYFCNLKRAVGADVSEEALEVAKQNEERLCRNGDFNRKGIALEWICTDMFEKIEEKFDCIISNPPYIPTSLIETLAEEVKDYEPYQALDGREDGLSFYRILAREAGNYLYSGGMLCLEIGFDQGEAVAALLEQYGFFDIQIKKDLAGRNRVCLGRWE